MPRSPRQRLRLALLKSLAHLTPSPPPQSSPPSRILVIRPDHLGDLLFTTPALRLLRQRYPTAHVTALVGPWGSTVFSNNPNLDEIITLPFPGFTRRSNPSPWQPYKLLYGWARQLRGRYDLAIILRFDHWWGALLTYIAGVPQRVGYAVPEVTPFLSQAVPYTPGWHQVAHNLQLVNWGFEDWVSQYKDQSGNPPVYQFTDHPLEFHIPEQATAWARDQFPTHRPIAIHPGAGAAVKLWQAGRWAEVADALADEVRSESQILMVLTGSQIERSLCLEIARRMKTPARVMAGETTLNQLAALLNRCQMVLGPDSGPLHLAVAVGTPTVHLYGPVDRATFGPWGSPERHRALTSDWPCIPCNRLDYTTDVLAHHPCVREIGVVEVLAAARQVLST